MWRRDREDMPLALQHSKGCSTCSALFVVLETWFEDEQQLAPAHPPATRSELLRSGRGLRRPYRRDLGKYEFRRGSIDGHYTPGVQSAKRNLFCDGHDIVHLRWQVVSSGV